MIAITDKQPKELILPIIILVLSILNITNYLDFSNIISLLVSLLGFAGIAMFFTKKGNYNLLFQIWILSQFILIYKENVQALQNGVQILTETPIFMTSQFFKLSFGLNLGLKGGTILHIDFNFIPLFYFGLYKITATTALIGKRIRLARVKRDTKYKNDLPVCGTISQRVEVEKEKDWLLVKLETSLEIGNIQTNKVLIHPKEKENYKKKKGIISYIRLVKDEEQEISNVIDRKEDYPFYEWLSIKLEK